MLVETRARPAAKIEFKSSHAFHRTTYGHKFKNEVGDQFVLENHESFDPVTQELYRYLPAITRTKSDNTNGGESPGDTCTREPHRAWPSCKNPTRGTRIQASAHGEGKSGAAAIQIRHRKPKTITEWGSEIQSDSTCRVNRDQENKQAENHSWASHSNRGSNRQ
jgi:hypothetical protein